MPRIFEKGFTGTNGRQTVGSTGMGLYLCHRLCKKLGIVLARDKDELLVKYVTYGMDTNLFVSKYELYLPNREDLKQLVDKIMSDEED